MDAGFLSDATPFINNILIEAVHASFNAAKRGAAYLKSKDYIGAFSRRYSSHLMDKYGVIRVLGSTRPLQLDYIYTHVKCNQQIRSRQVRDIAELYEKYSYGERKTTIDFEIISGDEAVDKYNKFVLLGGPGSGKTTFLKFTTLRSARGKTKNRHFPILLSLREYTESEQTLIDFIVSEFDSLGVESGKDFLVNLLNKGLCLVMFDGLDEVNQQNLDYVIRSIKTFTSKYYNNSYIISCRTADYNQYFDNFTDVELADLGDDEIISYVNGWFTDNPDKAKECIEEILNDPPIRELARLPLSLSMLCLNYDMNYGFPRNRAELYSNTLEALLGQWDATRSIKRDEIYKNLSRKRKESFFSKLAATTFESNKIYFKKAFLAEQISGYLSNLPGVNISHEDIDGEAVLKAIEIQHGILVEQARGIYSFAHLSFQEFYTSKYIITNLNKTLLQSLISGHLFNTKWQEVFILVAVGLDDAEYFFDFLQEELKNKYFENQSVNELFRNILYHCMGLSTGKISLSLAVAGCLLDMVDQYASLVDISDEAARDGDDLSLEYSIMRYLKSIIKLQLPDNIRFMASRHLESLEGDNEGAGYFATDRDERCIARIPVPFPIDAMLDIEDIDTLTILRDIVYGNYIMARGLLAESYLNQDLRKELLGRNLIPPV